MTNWLPTSSPIPWPHHWQPGRVSTFRHAQPVIRRLCPMPRFSFPFLSYCSLCHISLLTSINTVFVLFCFFFKQKPAIKVVMCFSLLCFITVDNTMQPLKSLLWNNPSDEIIQKQKMKGIGVNKEFPATHITAHDSGHTAIFQRVGSCVISFSSCTWITFLRLWFF